jgi:hypothetical protein
MKRRRRYYDTDDSDDDITRDGNMIVPDGGRVRVNLCDAPPEVREVYQRQIIRDALSWHQALASHRPGYCADILKWCAYDAALEQGLAGAIEARDAAYEERNRRGDNAWRHLGDAVPDQLDQTMPPGILNGNDDDDDDDDDSELAKTQRARDQAYEQMKVRGDNAWRNPGQLDPTAADRVRAQGMAWRHGR